MKNVHVFHGFYNFPCIQEKLWTSIKFSSLVFNRIKADVIPFCLMFECRMNPKTHELGISIFQSEL